eukprot:SAG31_NODE_45132_length_260_cov_0.639752_1_plen_23_part_10
MTVQNRQSGFDTVKICACKMCVR